MSETRFQFGDYSVRPVNPADRERLAAWIAADPAHSAQGIDASFFLDEEPGVGCYVLEDAAGPVFFFRTSNVVRLDVQFGPSESDEERQRNRDALFEGTDWFAAVCAQRGATEIVFESGSQLLRRAAVQRMGFEPLAGELRRPLDIERHALTFPKAGDTVPQQKKGGS